MMAIVLQLSLCMYEVQGLVVYVDDHFPHQNLMLAFFLGFHNGIPLCHRWDIFILYLEVSHSDMPLDAPAG